MPVDDHPIHPSTQKGDDFRYGCWNREKFADGYSAPNRIHRPDGTFYVVLTFVRYNMSTGCKYDLSNKDLNCRECKHRLSPVTFQVTNAE